MISVAVQTEVSIAKPDEFAEEQTGSPSAVQNEPESSSATTEHCSSSDPSGPGATQSN